MFRILKRSAFQAYIFYFSSITFILRVLTLCKCCAESKNTKSVDLLTSKNKLFFPNKSNIEEGSIQLKDIDKDNILSKDNTIYRQGSSNSKSSLDKELIGKLFYSSYRYTLTNRATQHFRQ